MAEIKGPPFTVPRYGSLGASIIAERDWLKQENERLREFISAFQELLDLDPENHPGTDLGRLMLEITEYLRHQPQTAPQSDT